MKIIQATGDGPGARTLPPNDVWNIPDKVDDVRFDFTTHGLWRIVKSIKGLTMDRSGRIYGIRTLTNCRESGYQIEGRVSIGGKKHRAFTSSQLFQRSNGSLCDVAVLYVCIPD